MLDLVAPTEAQCRTILGSAYDEIRRRLVPPAAPVHERPDVEEEEQPPAKKRRASARLVSK